MILIVEITSYPETCAEHGAARSASASASSLSTFVIIFFSKYARAHALWRNATNQQGEEYALYMTVSEA